MQRQKRIFIQDIIFLLVILVGIFAILLGTRPLNTPDEGRYAEIAREMLTNGNYITPYLNHLVFFDKPPLMYWLMAASMNIFGVGIWAVRLIPALFALLGCLMTFFTCHQLYNRRIAWLASIIQATSLLYFALAHYINMDMAIAVLISMSLQSFLLAINQTQKAGRWYLYLAYIFSALAVLTKGLIGFVLPVMIIGCWVVYCNQWSQLKKIISPIGFVIFFIIVLPWYILVQQSNPEFFSYFFIFEQFTRFIGHEFNNVQPVLFYIPIILLGMLPWTVFTVPALKFSWPKWSNRIKEKNAMLLLLWVIVITIFFSIPQSKISSYILPIFPALAMLTAVYINHIWDRKKTWHIILAINLAIYLILIAVLFYGLKHSLGHFQLTTIKANVYAIIAVLLCSMGLQVIVKKSLWRLIIIALFFLLFMWAILWDLPLVTKDSTKNLTTLLQSKSTSQSIIVSYENYYQDLAFYLQRKIMVVSDWQNSQLKYQDDSIGQLAWDGQYNPHSQQWLLTKKHFWKLWHSHKAVYVFLDQDLLTEFNQKAKTKVCILGQEGYIRLVTNQLAKCPKLAK